MNAALPDDQHDWHLETVRALVAPSTAEDAALACAAAWINLSPATSVSVVVFDATDQCVVADGRREADHVTVSAGRQSCGFSMLLHPERLCEDGGPCRIDQPNLVLCWTEHFSAVLVSIDESLVAEDRWQLLEELSRRLLSRWTTPMTSFADPAHMEALAEFAAGAGHEINNPLGSIIGQTQRLLKKEDEAERRQALETIGAQAWRIRDMIGDTMLFARPPQPEFSSVDLRPLTQRVVQDFQSRYQAIKLSCQLPADDGPIPVYADEAQLANLTSQLVRNACEATIESDAGIVTVRLRHESNGTATLVVEDNGAPIPDDIRRHLFDPFFSGRQAGRGLGFGLCHCWQIARMHNGLFIHEPTETGNRFVVVLPGESLED